MNYQPKSLALITAMVSGGLVTTTSASSLIVDITAGATAATPADFQVADPNLAADAEVTPLDLAAYTAALAVPPAPPVPIVIGDFSITPLDEAPLAFANSAGASYTDGVPILDEYIFWRSNRPNNDEGAFEISGFASMASGLPITLTLYGVGDNVGQQSAFSATFGTATAAGETVFTTVGQGDATGSVPFVQFTSFTTDGTTDIINIQVDQATDGDTRYPLNAFSVSVLLPNPTVALSTTASEPVSGSYTVDVTFDSDVSGLEASDFAVTNGVASAVLPASGPASTYTVTIDPTASGDVTVSLPAAAAQDGAFLDSLASSPLTTFAVLPGNDQATVTLSTTAGDPAVGPYVVDVLFSEEVTGVDVGDFTIVNGTINELLPAEGPASVYSFTVDPTANGTVEVTLTGAGITDIDDNLPSADSNTLTTNVIVPTVPVANLTFDPNDGFTDGILPNGTSFNVLVNFSETIAGLEAGDFVVTNGQLDSLTELTAGLEFRVAVTPTAPGLVTVELPADSVADLDTAAQGGQSFGNVTTTLNANHLAPNAFAISTISLSGRVTDPFPNLLADGESGGFFPTPRTFSPLTDGNLDDIPWTDGINSGTFDLSFVASTPLDLIVRSGRGGFGPGLTAEGAAGALIGPDESISLGSFIASNVTGAPAGLGITNVEVLAVFLGNFGGEDSTLINGQAAIGTGGGAFAEAGRNRIDTTSLVDIVGTGGDGGTITGLAISYQVGVPPLERDIVDCGLEGDNFFIEVSGGTDGLIVTSSDTLDFANSSLVNATVDAGNPNRFLIPSSERNIIRDFFRVEEPE